MMRRIRLPIGIGPQPVLGWVAGATAAGWVVHRLGLNRFPGLDFQSRPAQPAGQLTRSQRNHNPVAGVTYFDLDGHAARFMRRPTVRCEPFGELLGTEFQTVALTARQP